MGLYKHPTENRNFIAPDREPSPDFDADIARHGMMVLLPRPTPRLVQSADSSRSAGTGSGPNGNFIGSDVRKAYVGNSTLTGAGQSLGLMELEGYNISDVDKYFKKFGTTLTVPVNGISVDGSPLTCTGSCTDDGEQVLDIEYAISMAPGLSQVQVYVAAHAISVLSRMASDNTSKQLSTSWGWGEKFATNDPLFKEMAAQGRPSSLRAATIPACKRVGPGRRKMPISRRWAARI